MSAAQGVGMAANIAGGEIQGWAAILDKWNMFDEYWKELDRQSNYRDQAMGQFGKGLAGAGSDAAARQLKEGYGQRMGAYNDIAATPLSLNNLAGQQGLSTDKLAAQQMGQNRAQLGAYGDWQSQQDLSHMATQGALNQILNFAGGTASVFPYRMYEAQHSNDDLAMVGQAISSIGGGSSNYSQYASQPQAFQSQPVDVGGSYGPAMWSGYGGVQNLPPPGTSYNPYTDQNMVGYGVGLSY